MFDGPDYPQALDESLFDSWFEIGRSRKIPYAFMLIIWDDIEFKYQPVFVESRNEIQEYELYGSSPGQQLLIAAYDLYSESKIA